MRDLDAVLFANEAFYAAFATQDFDAMQGLWSEENPISCIHPGWSPQHGREVVLGTWQAILTEQAPPIHFTGAEAYMMGECAAIVTCFEIVENSVLAASNIFAREDGNWRLVHHQSGPAPTSLSVPRAGSGGGAKPTVN